MAAFKHHNLYLITLMTTIFVYLTTAQFPDQGHIGIGTGSGWADASGTIQGGTGSVSSSAVASSDSSVSVNPDGSIIVGAHGNGVGESTGSVNADSPENGAPNTGASIDLTGNGGANTTTVIIGENSSHIFKKLISLIPNAQNIKH